MAELIPIEGNSNLARDPRTGAILNQDPDLLIKVLEARKRTSKIAELEKQINTLTEHVEKQSHMLEAIMKWMEKT